MSKMTDVIATLEQHERSTELLERFSKMLPYRVVLRKEGDKYQALCENSFCMSFEKHRVCIFWSGIGYSMLGEHKLDAISWATHNAKEGDLVIDPLSDECPIMIDWIAWLTATSKYNQRNAPFTQ